LVYTVNTPPPAISFTGFFSNFSFLENCRRL
jgi:hypothetical protein